MTLTNNQYAHVEKVPPITMTSVYFLSCIAVKIFTFRKPATHFKMSMYVGAGFPGSIIRLFGKHYTNLDTGSFSPWSSGLRNLRFLALYDTVQWIHNLCIHVYKHLSLQQVIRIERQTMGVDMLFSSWQLRRLNRENPGSNPFAAVSKLWQFGSLHVPIAHSAVYMSTWLQTEIDI